MDSNYKVCVRCFTFNHSKFIESAMNGFSMQQTDFPFVCCIVDDASTDGEQLVIKNYLKKNFILQDDQVYYELETEYANIFFAQHKTNQNCFFAVLLLKYNHYSLKKDKIGYLSEWRSITSYEATCEGDDYWIDPIKLQKQYSFMESHKDYYLCGTNGLILWDAGVKAPSYFHRSFADRELLPEDIIGKWCMPTASLFYRIDLLHKVDQFNCKTFNGDLTMILISLANGRIWSFGSSSIVYRKNENPDSASNILKKKNDHGYFLLSQYKKVYEQYNLYTNKTYDTLISSYLKQVNSLMVIIHLRKYVGLFAYLIHPMIGYRFGIHVKLKDLFEKAAYSF